LPDIFLSYSRDDLPTAQRFAEAFEREGLSVWWDQTLNPGEHYDHITEKALKEARAVVVLWSKKSVDSRWVRAEATQAERNKTLVPAMIEPCDRPIMFELTHTADLSQWNGDPKDRNWQAYLAGVRRFVQREAATPSPAGVAPAVTADSRRGVWISAAAAVLIFAAGAVWFATRAPKPAGSGAFATTAAPAAASEVTLAVLPFADMSTAHDQEAFSDGLTEEILNQLAQIKAMRVTGRTSSFSFKGKNEDLRIIADKLGVGNLLEGSIRKDGNQLRITAQLINGKDGAHLWSQTYDRELSGIFALQEEIAKDVAKALSITLDVGDLPRAQGGTTNIDAYEKFLRAEALADKLESNASVQSVQLYREAVALDPEFARAWYGLYGVLELGLVSPDPKLAANTRKEMSDVSAHVVALAPSAWWTQTMLAQRFRSEHKWTESEAAVTKAVATAPPAMISVTQAYVLFLWAVGRMQEAADYMNRVHPANPLSHTDRLFRGLSLDFAGRSDEAQAECESAKSDLTGADWDCEWPALLRLWSRPDATPAAINAQVRRVLQKADPNDALDRILAGGIENQESARAAMRHEFEYSVSRNAALPFDFSRFADHFGDKDLALATLRRNLIDLRGVGLHEPWLPFETNLRADPRFKELLRDLGLVDYFRASGNWGDFCKPIGKDDFECH
jgi:TolB-like protein